MTTAPGAHFEHGPRGLGWPVSCGSRQLMLDQPIDDLIDRVLEEHIAIRRDLAEAGALMDVARLRPVFEALRDELLEHLLKEERVLFPWIRSGRGATAVGPIRAMGWEHDATLAQIARLRELTSGYRAPDPAAAPLFACLERLDRGLRAHIELENDVLFPRALGR